MASVFDTAQYILERLGPMTAMKLQKLVYYSQAWSIVWDDDVLFPEVIEAWKNGPVVPVLWNVHRGQFHIANISNGAPGNLTTDQAETVDQVLSFYGNENAQWLSDLTHMEDPWKDAWGSKADIYQNPVITPESLSEYYSTIEPPTE